MDLTKLLTSLRNEQEATPPAHAKSPRLDAATVLVSDAPDLEDLLIRAAVIAEDSEVPHTLPTASQHQANVSRKELAQTSSPSELPELTDSTGFVDRRVADRISLDVLVTDQDTDPRLVVLNSDRDGLSHVTQIIAEHSDLSDIDLVAHGTERSLLLGSESVDQVVLGHDKTQLERRRDSMSTEADILIYGCDVAAGDTAHQFVRSFSEITGSNVAASTDASGDWQLELTHRAIATYAIAFPELHKTLATITVSLSKDVVEFSASLNSDSLHLRLGPSPRNEIERSEDSSSWSNDLNAADSVQSVTLTPDAASLVDLDAGQNQSTIDSRLQQTLSSLNSTDNT